jgi:hypothetical protein
MTRLATLLFLAPLVAAQGWWQPAARTTWDIQLDDANDTIASNPATIIDIDLEDAAEETINEIHGAGKRVICYFSAGSYENWRDDAEEFEPTDYANPLGPEWPGEWWIITTSENVRRIMRERLDLAVEKGCDGVDPDNIDAYDNENGWGATEETAIDYVRFLAEEGHARGLAVGLKNGGNIVEQVVGKVDFEVNEQCVEYQECATFSPFIAAGKPVFGIEYPPNVEQMPEAERLRICEGIWEDQEERATEGHSTVLKNMSLDAWVYRCPIV